MKVDNRMDFDAAMEYIGDKGPQPKGVATGPLSTKHPRYIISHIKMKSTQIKSLPNVNLLKKMSDYMLLQ